tara:strand:- start:627 stop:1433 length:807 start_codon:yes stop_codon:yes gene_type:complete
MDNETNKFHALQLFTDTFSAETVHLTNDAVGIYIRLLCFSWTKNAKPFKEKDAYRICQCIDEDCKIKVMAVLTEFFIPKKLGDPQLDGEFIFSHKRLIKEHKYLTEKYQKRAEAGRKGGLAKSDNASSKNVAPIPIPSPIPNKNIQSMFEKFWSLLKYKKGSKHLANKKYDLYCSNSDPKDISDRFNRYASTVKDKEFLAHVSTWLNQKRFEDEETNKPIKIPEPVFEFNGIKLKKYAESGAYIELKDDNGNKYQKHKWNGKPIEKAT